MTSRKRPTLKDVAALSGVTPAIVSRVINEDKTLNIKDETRKKVIKSVKELNYSTNIIAKSLRTKTSKIVAIIIPDILNPFFHQLIKGAQEFFIKKDVSLMLCDTRDDIDMEKKYIETLYNQQIEGVLFLNANLNNDVTELLERFNINYVLVNRGTHSNKLSVKADDMNGAKMAVNHLIELGHKKIAHISGDISTETGFDRLSGYRDTIMNNNLVIYPEYILLGKFNESEGYISAKKLLGLKTPPTAIFAANDLIAIGAIKAITEKGLKVPEDISVIGYNDIWISSIVNPPLTTIKSPLYEMGYVAAKSLYNILNENESKVHNVLLPVELVIRESTATPKQ